MTKIIAGTSEDRFSIALDLAVKGYMREWDGPSTHNSKLATAIAILHQTADDWAENLAEQGPGSPGWDKPDERDLSELCRLLERNAAPSVIRELANTTDDPEIEQMARDLFQTMTGESA